jgi:L-amino acid N-acyltransferase YncA
MSAANMVARNFPWVTQVGGEQVTFRLMTPEDQREVLEFVKALPERDLYYLMNDVREPAGMERWIEGLRGNKTFTVLAETGAKLIGYGSLWRGRMPWLRHVGEVRIMVSPAARGRGLGKLLAKEIFAVAHDLDLKRLIVRLTSAQTSACYLFQSLGFHIEAILAECVIDEQERTQDLIFMSYDVAGFHG